MYAGMDAWILTQLIDSILTQSAILNTNNDMKKVVKSLCREYYLTVPDPIKNFIVSTAVGEERTVNTIMIKDNNDNKNDIITPKSLPLRAMMMRELNMPKNWDLPEVPYQY